MNDTERTSAQIRDERLTTVAHRIRGFREPTSGATRSRTLPGMRRTNEPEERFLQPDEPRSAAQIAKEASQPASHLNLNVGYASRAEATIKGVAGVAIECFPAAATAAAERIAKTGRLGTIEEVAGEVLQLDRVEANQLFNGPVERGHERAWLSPEDVAIAVENTRDRPAETWSHVDSNTLKRTAQIGDDYGAYFHAIAKREAAEGTFDPENGRAGRVAELEQLWQRTRIDPEASIAPEAQIGRGATIEAHAQVGEADIGRGATIRAHATIKFGATVTAYGYVGEHSRVYTGAMVSAIGAHTDVLEGATQSGTLGDQCIVGAGARVDGEGGNNVAIGSESHVEAVIGTGTTIGKDTTIRKPPVCHALGEEGRHIGAGPSTTVIPAGSTIGDNVSATAGWRNNGTPLQIGDHVRINATVRLPPKTILRARTTIEDSYDVRQLLGAERIPAKGISESAFVHPAARIHKDAAIGAGAHIGKDTEIGAGAVIGKHAQVGAGSDIGARTTIETYAKVGRGSHVGHDTTVRAGAQIGDNVELGNNVEIGTGTQVGDGCSVGDDAKVKSECVLRPRVTIEGQSQSHIGEGARTGTRCNLEANVRVNEQARIGARTTLRSSAVIGANALVGDDTTIGRSTWIAPQAQVGDGCVVDDNAEVGKVKIPSYRHVPDRIGGITRQKDAAGLQPVSTTLPPTAQGRPPVTAPTPAAGSSERAEREEQRAR